MGDDGIPGNCLQLLLFWLVNGTIIVAMLLLFVSPRSLRNAQSLASLATISLLVAEGVITACLLRFWIARRRTLNHFEGVESIKSKYKTHWFWGDFREYRERLHDFPQFRMEALGGATASKTVPPIFSRFPNVTIVDPEDIKHVLKANFNNYIKPPDFIENFGDALGSGIFITNHGPHSSDGGEKWHRQRKTSAKIFTRANFKKHFLERFEIEARMVCRVLSKYERSNTPVDVQRLMGNFTLDSIGHVAFGCDLGCLQRELASSWQDGTTSTASKDFALAFDTAQHLAIKRFVRPLQAIVPPFLRSFVFEDYRKMKRARTTMQSFCNMLITEAERCRANDIVKWRDRHDLLAMHMRESDKHTRQDLCDMILSFFIAGRDTTRATLTFFFKVLAENPEIEKELFREIDNVFGRSQAATEANETGGRKRGRSLNTLSWDVLQPKKLPYLDGLIREVLRLYPPVYSDPKFAVSDDVLPSGIKIPKSTVVSYMPFAMGRMKDFLYGSTPLKIDPTRWIDQKKPSDFEFPVFQAGPRICLGMRMAYLEVKAMVVQIVREGFCFRLVPGQDLEKYNLQPTLVLEDGLNMRVVRRR